MARSIKRSAAPTQAELGPNWEIFRQAFKTWSGIVFPGYDARHVMTLVRDLAAERGMSIDAYVRYCSSDAGREERQRVIDRLVIKTTWFLREAAGLYALISALCQRAARLGEKRVRLWSAGCSTGQEPYTITMALLEAGLDPHVLGTDISGLALATAREARYPAQALASLPPQWIAKYTIPCTDRERGSAPQLRIAKEITSRVTFALHNLVTFDPASNSLPQATGMDAIVCCNVLIHFQRSECLGIVRNLARACRPDGYILLSATERPLVWLSDALAGDDETDPLLLRPSGLENRPASAPRRTPVPAAAAGTSPLSSSPRGTSRGPRSPLPHATKPTATDGSRRPDSRPDSRPEKTATPPGAASPPRRRTSPPRGGAALRSPSPSAAQTASIEQLAVELLRDRGAAKSPYDPTAALETLDAMLARDSLAATAHLTRGLVLKRCGRLSDAAQAFRCARFLTGDDGWLAPYQLALTLEQLDNVREAQEAFRHALAVAEAGGASGLSLYDDADQALRKTVAESCRARLGALGRQ